MKQQRCGERVRLGGGRDTRAGNPSVVLLQD